jgi:hypothetical protein
MFQLFLLIFGLFRIFLLSVYVLSIEWLILLV